MTDFDPKPFDTTGGYPDRSRRAMNIMLRFDRIQFEAWLSIIKRDYAGEDTCGDPIFKALYLRYWSPVGAWRVYSDYVKPGKALPFDLHAEWDALLLTDVQYDTYMNDAYMKLKSGRND